MILFLLTKLTFLAILIAEGKKRDRAKNMFEKSPYVTETSCDFSVDLLFVHVPFSFLCCWHLNEKRMSDLGF
jgi:hypothetical protein